MEVNNYGFFGRSPVKCFLLPEMIGKFGETRKTSPPNLFSTSKNPPPPFEQNTKHRCKGRPKLQRAKPGDGFCPRQNGVYPSPDPSECHKFYSCLNGVGSPHTCADGLHFDEKLGTCVWARESGRKGCLTAGQRASAPQRKKKKPATDRYVEMLLFKVTSALPEYMRLP